MAVTAAGRDLQDQVADVPSRLVESLGLDTAEFQQLRRLLDGLLDRLDAEPTGPTEPTGSTAR